MLCDRQTNKVYFSEGLQKYKRICSSLLDSLRREDIPYEFLPYTESEKHVWARDFMPVQLEEGIFLQYVYSPDYLKDCKEFIPDYPAICKELKLECIKTDIVLDGGNVIKCGNKVIMTYKIFQENPGKTKEELTQKLEKLLDARLIIIPWDKYEMFGHADGMVRAIGENKVLLNNYIDFDPYLRQRLLKSLSPHFEVEELHYGIKGGCKFSWAYLNFLQIKNCIFVPGFGVKEDDLALEQIQKLFPDHKAVQIGNCADLAKEGGALNCISWNIIVNNLQEYEI